MKILLVGGRGALARALAPVLAPFAEVLTAGRTGCDMALDLAWPAERVVLPAGLDAVVNLAAHIGGRDADAMLAAEAINVLGALKLARACSAAAVGQLVHISSIFAALPDHSPFFSPYALSKRHAEEVLGLYSRSAGLPLAILRPAQLYGAGEASRPHQPFLYGLLDRAERGEDIVLYGSNDAVRNFIHIDDVAQVCARVLRQRIEGRYDCASLDNVRFSAMAAAAVAAFGSTSTIRVDRTQPDVADNGYAADGALYARIGYFPTITLEQGLAREAARRRGGR